MTHFCILNILSDTRNTPKDDAPENKGSQINLNSGTYSQIILCKKCENGLKLTFDFMPPKNEYFWKYFSMPSIGP